MNTGPRYRHRPTPPSRRLWETANHDQADRWRSAANSHRATLLGVRGRSTEEGVRRWFRRFSATSFDQEDIRFEAQAFEAFVEGANAAYGLDPTRMIFLGYSNGANLLAALRCFIRIWGGRPSCCAQCPGEFPGRRSLGCRHSDDLRRHGSIRSVLEQALRASGARVDTRTACSGHELVAPILLVGFLSHGRVRFVHLDPSGLMRS